LPQYLQNCVEVIRGGGMVSEVSFPLPELFLEPLHFQAGRAVGNLGGALTSFWS
jgi:hypothetical protein